MSTKVTYSDGTSEVLSDSEVDNMAPEIQKNVTNLEPVADTQIPYLPTAGNENGQTTLEKVDAGNPIANLDQTITNGLDKTFVQPTKEYVNRLGTDYITPAWNLIKAHPGATAALLGTALIPGSTPLMSGAIAAGLGATGEAIDKAHPFTTEPNEWTTGSGVDNAVDVLGSGLGMGLGTWGAGKLFGRLGEVFGRPGNEKAAYDAAKTKYDADLLTAQANHAQNQQDLAEIEKNAEAMKAKLAGQTVMNDAGYQLPAALSTAQRAHLEAIKDQLMYSNPAKYAQFGFAYRPSDEEALNFYNTINSPLVEPPLPAQPKGVNIIQGFPNIVKSNVEGVLGGEQGLFGGKLYPWFTDNFLIPKITTAANDVVAKPATLASGLGGYALGSNVSAVPDAVQLLKQEADAKKKRLQLLNRFSK